MAIIDNGYLRGQVGNLVNRKVGDLNVVQTRPSKIRQSEWTKAAATDFGSASSAASLIRRSLYEVHQGLHDGKLHNRLVVQLQRVMNAGKNASLGDKEVSDGNLSRLVHFQFNADCHLHDHVFFDPLCSFDHAGQLQVHFPSFNRSQHLRKPKACNHIVLKLGVFGFSFLPKYRNEIGLEELEIPLYGKDNPAFWEERTWHFDCSNTKGQIILVTLSVLYLYQDNSTRSFLYNTKELNPAGIIGAFKM